MESSIFSDIDVQVVCMQQALDATSSLKKKCLKLENEKKQALQKCIELELKLERLNKEDCAKCKVLLNKLNQERKEKEKVKREEKAKLLKSIAKTLESIDDANTNQMTNAQQLFTQLVCDGFNESPERKKKRTFSIIEDEDEREDDSKVLVNETVIAVESEESNDSNVKFAASVVVPETPPVSDHSLETGININNKFLRSGRQPMPHSRHSRIQNSNLLKENKISSEDEVEIESSKRKLEYSPTLPQRTVKDGPTKYSSPKAVFKYPPENIVVDQSIRSPSVLSEIIEGISGTSNTRSSALDDKGTIWKMKPSVLVENDTDTKNTRRMKQMTLSLTRPEKKHDISLSQGFKGGVAKLTSNHTEADEDVILPSPERAVPWKFNRKNLTSETMEDPDMTVFQPAITSTCLPTETSFDKLPEREKSPPFKHRRETVRKKAERQKLPGQECDECAKYYEAVGLNKTQDIQNRKNTCSRHRDKHQIRANTPPGYWDPKIPVTPEDSEDDN